MVAMEYNKKLKKLNLASNQIGQASIQALCQSLNTNKTLESLDLHGNEFGVQDILVNMVFIYTKIVAKYETGFFFSRRI